MVDDILGVSRCGDNAIELNSIINAKLEAKKLRINQDKSFRILIKQKKMKIPCPTELKVHNQIMKVQVKATHLGDILNRSGDINDTITAREMKAKGINSQIFSMLNSLSLGMFYFDIALVMRDAMLINAILTNSESWPFISKKNMNTLESADSQLMQKIFNSHSKTVRESYFIETGKLEIKHIIGKRKLLYLWHIFTRKKR